MSEKQDKQERSETLIQVLKELIGERSIRRVAEESGVTATYISLILNGKRFPSNEVLRKLAAPEANPQNGITLTDLLVSARYIEAQALKDEQLYADDTLEKIRNTDSDGEGVLTDNRAIDLSLEDIPVLQGDFTVNGTNTPAQKFSNAEFVKKVGIMKTAIFSALGDKMIPFVMKKNESCIRGYLAHLTLELFNSPISTWYFDIIPKRIQPRAVVAKYIFIEPDPQKKVTAVYTDSIEFKLMCQHKGKIAYRGELSAILIDAENMKVLKEEYLSHYEEGDDKKEILLV